MAAASPATVTTTPTTTAKARRCSGCQVNSVSWVRHWSSSEIEDDLYYLLVLLVEQREREKIYKKKYVQRFKVKVHNDLIPPVTKLSHNNTRTTIG